MARNRNAGRKRQRSKSPSVSHMSTVSEPIGSDGETQVVPQKRMKRIVVDDRDQLNLELRQSLSQPSRNDTAEVAAAEKKQKRARFSEPPTGRSRIEDSTTPIGSPLPLQVEKVKKTKSSRYSLPAQTPEGLEIQYPPLIEALGDRQKRRLRRSHLSETINDIEDHKKQDAKDREELQKLRRLVREKDDRQKELEYELEVLRQNNMNVTDDEESREKEEELAILRSEIAQLKSQAALSASQTPISENMEFDDDAVDNDNDFGLVHPGDLDITQEQLQVEPHAKNFYTSISSNSQNTISQSSTEASTQLTIPDPHRDVEVAGFRAEIAKLEAAVAESNTITRIITVELQNLEITRDVATVTQILDALRHSFTEGRAQLELLFPGEGQLGLKNYEVLPAMIEHIRGLMLELKEKAELADKHKEMENLYEVENKALLDKLAEKEDRENQIEQRMYSLDVTNDQQRKTIIELEDDVSQLQQTLDERDNTITDKDITIHGLEDELQDKNTDADRLRNAIESYRADLSRLEATILQMEEEHTEKIKVLTDAHNETVQGLATELAQETEARQLFEETTADQAAFIEELEGRINSAEEQVDELRSHIAQLQQHLDTEKTNRLAAEVDGEEKGALIADLEARIERANSAADELVAEVDSLRDALTSERQLREATETDLANREEQIAALRKELEEAGTHANELRSKLFQVQQEKEKTVKELQTTIDDNDTRHHNALSNEIEDREAIERDLADRDEQLVNLKRELARTEENEATLTTELENVVAQRDHDISRLNTDLEAVRHQLCALEQSSSLQVAALEETVRDLTNELNDRKADVDRLENEAAVDVVEHRNELADREEEISDLNSQLMTSRAENERLEKEKASVEERLSACGIELLNFQDKAGDEIDALKVEIKAKQESIDALEQLNDQQAEDHARVLAEKLEDVERLKLAADTRAITITNLEGIVEDLKRTFAAQQEAARDTINRIKNDLRNTLQHADDVSAAYDTHADAALKAVKDMKIEGVHVHTHGVKINKVAKGRVSKVTEKVKVGKKGRDAKPKKKPVRDSGFGMAESEEDEYEAVGGDATALVEG